MECKALALIEGLVSWTLFIVRQTPKFRSYLHASMRPLKYLKEAENDDDIDDRCDENMSTYQLC